MSIAILRNSLMASINHQQLCVLLDWLGVDQNRNLEHTTQHIVNNVHVGKLLMLSRLDPEEWTEDRPIFQLTSSSVDAEFGNLHDKHI